MKRAAILFLAFMLGLSLINAAAQAEKKAGAITTVPEAIQVLREHTALCEDEFTLLFSAEICKLFFKTDQELFSAIMRNNGAYSVSYTYETTGSVRLVSFSEIEYYSGLKIEAAFRSGNTSLLNAREKSALNKAKGFVDTLRGTALEKEKRIHDYLCDLVTYYTNEHTGIEEKDTAVGALLNGRADCDGFSDAFSLLCTMAGIENRRIVGTCSTDGIKGNHMWNAVRIDGKWCFVDVTNDNQPSEQTIYLYYNTGKETLDRTHVWNPEAIDVSVISRSDASLRNKDIQQGYVTNWMELASYIRREAEKKSPRVMFAYPSSFHVLSDFSRLQDIMYSSGMTSAEYAYTDNSIEIINIGYYSNFKIVSTEKEALSYLKQCKKAKLTDFTLICSDSLYQDLMKNNGKKIFSLLSEAGYSTRTISFIEAYGHIIIEDAR